MHVTCFFLATCADLANFNTILQKSDAGFSRVQCHGGHLVAEDIDAMIRLFASNDAQLNSGHTYSIETCRC